MGTAQAVQLLDATGVAVGTPPTARRVDPLTLVRDVEGTPLPPSAVVDELRRRTQCPELGLRYCNVSWQLIWTWSANDHRRERIRKGEYPETSAYDIVGTLPIDCSVDQAPSYAEKCLRSYPRDDARKLADAIAHYNVSEVARQQVATVLDATFGGGGDLQSLGGIGESVGRNTAQVTVVSDIGSHKHTSKGRRKR